MYESCNVLYADDICLMAISRASLRELIDNMLRV